jgi:hypothetical protein
VELRAGVGGKAVKVAAAKVALAMEVVEAVVAALAKEAAVQTVVLLG